jgi:hypothetical protein
VFSCAVVLSFCLQIWLGGSPNQTRLAKVFVERMKVRDLEATLEPLFAAFKARRQTPVSALCPCGSLFGPLGCLFVSGTLSTRWSFAAQFCAQFGKRWSVDVAMASVFGRPFASCCGHVLKLANH